MRDENIKYYSIDTVQSDAGDRDIYCHIPGYDVNVETTINEDWHYYSKSWHRQHGPKITVTDRRVNFYSDAAAEDAIPIDSILVPSYRGYYLRRAIYEFLTRHSIELTPEEIDAEANGWALITRAEAEVMAEDDQENDK